jgi:DNA ligase-1
LSETVLYFICTIFMKAFAELVQTLGTTTKTNAKLDALVHYFSKADDKDKVWVIALFSGRRPKRAVNTTQLAAIALKWPACPSGCLKKAITP